MFPQEAEPFWSISQERLFRRWPRSRIAKRLDEGSSYGCDRIWGGWKTKDGNDGAAKTRRAGGAVDTLPPVQSHNLQEGDGEPAARLPRVRLPLLSTGP